MARCRSTVLVVVVGAVLTGCGTVENLLAKATPTEPAAPAASETARAPVSPILNDLRPGQKPMRLDPNRLIGKSREQTLALLGKPTAITDKPPATVWGYRAGACALEVFFYMDLGAREFRALAYDVKTANNASDEDAITRCVGQIRLRGDGG